VLAPSFSSSLAWQFPLESDNFRLKRDHSAVLVSQLIQIHHRWWNSLNAPQASSLAKDDSETAGGPTMLFAILFDANDQLIAAAPAVFQYAVGNEYWRENYAGEVVVDGDFQTAYIEVIDDDTIDMLNSLELGDEHLQTCRQRVASLNGLSKKVPGTRHRAA